MGYEFKKLKQIYYYYFKNEFCDFFLIITISWFGSHIWYDSSGWLNLNYYGCIFVKLNWVD
jgi:hypothetical protein